MRYVAADWYQIIGQLLHSHAAEFAAIAGGSSMAILQLKQRTAPKLKLAPDEGLFPDQVTPGGLITCRVCERVENVCVGHPALLCGVCLGNLSATDAHVSGVYAAALAFFMEASESLRTAVEASPERAWWDKVERARMAEDKNAALFATAWARARASDGEKERLCLLSERMDQEAARLEPLNAWYTASKKELAAARAALGEPVEV